jgi:hypothetical protein
LKSTPNGKAPGTAALSERGYSIAGIALRKRRGLL